MARFFGGERPGVLPCRRCFEPWFSVLLRAEPFAPPVDVAFAFNAAISTADWPLVEPVLKRPDGAGKMRAGLLRRLTKQDPLRLKPCLV